MKRMTAAILGRKFWVVLAVATMIFSVLVVAQTESLAADIINLSMASLYPPESKPAQSLNRWAEKVKEDSSGKILIRHYPANTLVTAPDMRTGVRAGVADLGCSFIYKPEPGFDPSLIMSQLILGLDYEKCLKIYDDLWNKFPELWAGQWKDFKIIWITTIDPNLVVTAKKPVRKLEDMKGLQIRIPNAATAGIIKNLNAVPVSMKAADWIISLDKGTTDGATTSLGSLLDYKIGEKIDYITVYSMGPGITFLVMNKDTWNDLPPDMQKIVDTAAEWGKKDMIQTKMESVGQAIEYLKADGVEFFKLSEEEYARWDAAIRPVYDKIASDLNAKGFPGTELVNFALERAKYYYSN